MVVVRRPPKEWSFSGQMESASKRRAQGYVNAPPPKCTKLRSSHPYVDSHFSGRSAPALAIQMVERYRSWGKFSPKKVPFLY